jgi:hypothetical protein
MDGKALIECPFCLSSIDSSAWVCQYCSREVRMVLDLQKENRRLTEIIDKLCPESSEAEAQFAENEQKSPQITAPKPAKKKWELSMGMAGLFYFIASTGMMWLLLALYRPPVVTAWIPFFLYQCAFILLIPLLLLGAISFVKNSNLYVLACFVSFQPLLLPYVAADFFTGPKIISSITYSSCIFAAEFLFIGLFVWLFYRKDRNPGFFSSKTALDYFKPITDAYDIIGKLLTLALSGFAIYKLFGGIL